MEKFVKNGKVAVVYSPGYGSGWWTWNGRKTEYRWMVFSPVIARAVLLDDRKQAALIALKIDPSLCVAGAETLEVAWVTEGEAFEIEEYDGYERIELCYRPIFVA